MKKSFTVGYLPRQYGQRPPVLHESFETTPTVPVARLSHEGERYVNFDHKQRYDLSNTIATGGEPEDCSGIALPPPIA